MKKEKRAEKSARAGNEKRNSRGATLFDILCTVSGAFFLAVYLPYFVWHLIKGHPADVAASVLVFCGVLLPFFFRKLLRKLLRKLYLPLKAVWCFVMCFYMVSFLVFCGVIFSQSDSEPPDDGSTKVVVVFGCQVYEDRLSAELGSRTRKAAELLTEYPDALCVASGGRGSDEPRSEASGIAGYLADRYGISGDRVLLEEESSNTIENIRFSLETLKNAGYDPDECTFICVSSEFHTPRILLLGKRLGMDRCVAASAETPYKFMLYIYTVREYMSYVHLLIFGA